jgi:hypothetical protein
MEIEKVGKLRELILSGGELWLLAPSNPDYPISWGRFEVRTQEANYKVYVEIVERLGKKWMEENTEEVEDGRNTVWRSKQTELLI